MVAAYSHEDQPKNINHARFGRHRFEYEYRPVLALTLSDTTIAPKVFQKKRRLALFLERVVVKALSSTALDGLNSAVGSGVKAAQLLLTSTLGAVDRVAAKGGRNPAYELVHAATGTVAAAGTGGLDAGRKVIKGVLSGAKYFTSGLANGVTRGNVREVTRGVWGAASRTSPFGVSSARVEEAPSK